MSRRVYAVMELSGNFAHTLAEFRNRDEAAEFMLDRATEDAREEFIEGIHPDDIPEHEWETALENALSYYSIEGWEVTS